MKGRRPGLFSHPDQDDDLPTDTSQNSSDKKEKGGRGNRFAESEEQVQECRKVIDAAEHI